MSEDEIESEEEYEPDRDSQRYIIEPNPNSRWNRFLKSLKQHE